MKSKEDEIGDFVRILVRHPGCVKVQKIQDVPPTFRITAHKDDIPDLKSKMIAIEVIASPPRPTLLFIEAPVIH